MLALLTLPTVARAAVITLSHQEAQIEVEPGLIEVFDATAGGRLTWADPIAFEAGSGDGIAVSEEGLRLEPAGFGVEGLTAPDPAGPPWWDAAWPVRVCITIDHTDPDATTVPGAPIPIAVPLDALMAAGQLRPDFADVRAIATDGAAALPLWVDEHDDTVWVRAAALTAGTTETVCLYTGTTDPDVLSVDDFSTVFGAGAAQAVPDSWAVTAAVAPTVGLDQQFSFRAPVGDATVTIEDAETGLVVASILVAEASTVEWTEPANDPPRSGALRVSSTRPVAIEVTTLDGDGQPIARFPIVPDSAGGPLYGLAPAAIVSTIGPVDPDLDVPTPTATAERRRAADLSVTSIALSPGETATASGGVDPDEALAITADTALHGISTDGIAATSLLPRRELNPRYELATDASVLTIVCPEPDLVVTIDDPTADPELPPDQLTCTGASAPTATDDAAVGVVTDQTPRAAGTTVTAIDGRTFMLLAAPASEAPAGTTVVLGAKQNRPLIWPAPVLSTAIEGRYPEAATWRSAPRDTTATAGSNVWGEVTIALDTDTIANSVSAQIATGSDVAAANAATAIGPDGSAGTSFDDSVGMAAPVHNGDEAVRIEVTLRSPDGITTPTLTSVAIGHDLPLMARTPGLALLPSGTTTTGAGAPLPLVRIRGTANLPVGSVASVGPEGRLVDATTGLDGTGPAAFGPGSMLTVSANSADGPTTLSFIVALAGSGPRSVTEIGTGS